jgi:hypothetical protein
MHWVARQKLVEIPNDEVEVNTRDIHKCDGQAHDPDTMVAPLTPKTTRKLNLFFFSDATPSRKIARTLRWWVTVLIIVCAKVCAGNFGQIRMVGQRGGKGLKGGQVSSRKASKNMEVWINNPAKVMDWVGKYNLDKMLDKGGGLVKISNFFPEFVAEGILEVSTKNRANVAVYWNSIMLCEIYESTIKNSRVALPNTLLQCK